MPRVPRNAAGGVIYHVLNRSHSKKRIFSTDGDYQAFVSVLVDAASRYPVQVLSYCVMPNHWHLVLMPEKDGDLSRFMRWLTLTHTQRWRSAKNSVGSGAVYQGRFKSFPVQDDNHFLTLCRYVERNAKRANLVRKSEDWQWSSAWLRMRSRETAASVLTDWPVDRPTDWIGLLNERQNENDSEMILTSLRRSRPLGSPDWVGTIARKLGLGQTLRPPGRPKKKLAKSRSH